MLTALHVGDQVYGLDISVYKSDPPPFKIESTPSTGYIDIGSDDIKTGNNVPAIARPNASPILNWDLFGRGLGYDYLYVNDKIKALAVNDISTYSDEEKEVFLEHQIYSESILETEFSFDDVVRAGLEYRSLAVAARTRRTTVATIYLKSSVGDASARAIGLSVASELSLYVQQDYYGIVDYLDGINNYAGNGFLDQGLVSIVPGLSVTQIRDEIKSYFLNGTKVSGTPYFNL